MILRPYQQDAVESTLSYLKEGKGNPCIIAPTGSGKSLILAELTKRFNKPTLIVSHRKEILEQNEEKIRRIAPELKTGIYSASLNRKEIKPVTIAQIQSISKRTNSNILDPFKLIIIDEAHLISPNENTQYQKLVKACPDAAIVGLTATPMRLNDGAIIGEDQVFNAVSYEIKIKELVKDGFLCPLVGKSSVIQADLKDVQKRGGEYILEQARKAIDLDFLTLSAITECRKFASDRKAWIIFASGVEHAQKIGNAFQAYGITNRVITGETLPMLRDKYIKEFKNNEIKALINCDILSVGFDAPNVDCIILLRATASTAWYVQAVGRGMRPHPGKLNTLVLDFAGNLERHGPIDKINYKDFFDRPKGDGEAPGKICPKCRTLVHASIRTCPDCEHQFPEPEKKHDAKASELSPMGIIEKPREYFVTDIEVKVVRSKKDNTPMLMVLYFDGMRSFKEWVLFDHKGWARTNACKWWAERTCGFNAPIDSEDAANRFYKEAWAIKSVWVIKESFVGANAKLSWTDKVIGVTKEPFLLKDKIIEDELII